MKKGKFIVFEGIDGSGKSTQAQLLSERLTALGIECVLTREPTDGSCGKLLRHFLKGEEAIADTAVAALFTADRLDHITCTGGLLDMLSHGKNVVCDRYYFSSYAYNAHGRPVEDIISLNNLCSTALRPDICFFIDLSPEAAIKRITENRSADVREIYETAEYLKTVRERYLSAFRLTEKNEKVMVIDGQRGAQTIANEIFERVKELL